MLIFAYKMSEFKTYVSFNYKLIACILNKLIFIQFVKFKFYDMTNNDTNTENTLLQI
jgi:hypothetical protein